MKTFLISASIILVIIILFQSFMIASVNKTNIQLSSKIRISKSDFILLQPWQRSVPKRKHIKNCPDQDFGSWPVIFSGEMRMEPRLR